MRLWTVQTEEVYKSLLEKGVLYSDKTKSECLKNFNRDGFDETFLTSYNWLVPQMDQRIEHNKNAEFPWWAWYKYNWKNEFKDSDMAIHGTPGKEYVCLEIEVPDEEVVLSDYNNWHYVLNNNYLDDSENEEDWERIQEEFDNLTTDEKQRLTEESWQRIFDVEPYETDWRSQGRYVQATFWELRASDIKDVRRFVAVELEDE